MPWAAKRISSSKSPMQKRILSSRMVRHIHNASRNGCLSNGMKKRKSLVNIGFRLYRSQRPSRNWYKPCKCDGASSTIFLNSKMSLGSTNTKADSGAAFIITQVCASPHTDSCSQNAGVFPPPDVLPSQSLPFPQSADPEVPPSILQRHNPSSLRSWRRRLEVELVRMLYRCPSCKRINENAPVRIPGVCLSK